MFVCVCGNLIFDSIGSTKMSKDVSLSLISSILCWLYVCFSINSIYFIAHAMPCFIHSSPNNILPLVRPNSLSGLIIYSLFISAHKSVSRSQHKCMWEASEHCIAEANVHFRDSIGLHYPTAPCRHRGVPKC